MLYQLTSYPQGNPCYKSCLSLTFIYLLYITLPKLNSSIFPPIHPARFEYFALHSVRYIFNPDDYYIADRQQRNAGGI